MKDRRIRIVYAIIGIGLALALSLAMGVHLRLSSTAGLWFEVLLWIVLAAFIVEPFFSGPNTALVNSISVIFICLAGGFRGPVGWWIVLLSISGVAIACLIVDLFLRDSTKDVSDPTQRTARVCRQIAVRLGSWRFSLIGALLLTLVAFNPPFTDPWIVSAVVLLYVFAVSGLEPHKLARIASGHDPEREQLVVERILAPAEVVLTGGRIDDLAVGDLLAVHGSNRSGDAIVLGPTYIQGRRGVRVFVADLPRLLHRTELDRLTLEEEPADSDSTFDAYRNQLLDDDIDAIGTVSEGSTMLELTAELFPDRRVELGEVLWTLRDGARTYWQVVDARIHRDTWGGDSHRCVTAQAIQLGAWRDAAFSFLPLATSPPHTDLVFAGPAEPGTVSIPTGFHAFASVPKTKFPVAANLRELSLHQ